MSKTPPYDEKAELSSYNILQSVSGLGRSIIIRMIHEMTDPSDVQNVLLSTTGIAEVVLDRHFIWSLSRVVVETYTLSTVPVHLIDLVRSLSYLILTSFRISLSLFACFWRNYTRTTPISQHF